MTTATGAERTRHRLLSAAAEEILEHGYAASSMAKIARRLDLTKGALGHHFPTKRTILVALLDESVRAAGDIARQVSALFPDSPLRACLALFAGITVRGRIDPVAGAALLLFQDPSVPAVDLVRIRDGLFAQVVQLVQRASDEEGHRFSLPDEAVARYLQTIIAGFLFDARFPDRDQHGDERLFMTAALTGIGVADADAVMGDVYAALNPD